MLTVAVPAEASFPGANGLIAFPPHVVQPPASIGTTTVPWTPSDPWPFIATGSVSVPRNIAWSPSGRQLAFDAPSTSLGTGQALYIVNADGTGLRQVGRGDRLRYNPAWSPDGTKLAFVQDNGAGAGSGDIYTMTTNGASLTRLTTSGSWDGSPDWSPDGTRIAYVANSAGKRQVWQMTPSGAGKSVTTAKLSFQGPVDQLSWSPDSTSIAFTAGGADETATPGAFPERLYRMSRAGSDLRLLAGPTGFTQLAKGVAWSPDGTRIAYLEENTGEFHIAAINSANGSARLEVRGDDSPFPLDAGSWQSLR